MEQEHYFDADPQVASRPSQVELVLPDVRLRLHTDRGVFAASGVDTGTVELLKSVPAPPGTGDLLDLGCGYGPIACTIAHRAPGATVWAVDVNRRALALTTRNAAEMALSNVRTALPDEVPPHVRFAAIWSNPPIRAGKAILHQLLDRWLGRLDDGGEAWLVVQRHLGGDSLAGWLSAQGWTTRRVASRKGYRILRVAP